MQSIPRVSTATPDPRAQRAAENGDHERTALYRLYDADGTVLYIGISADPDRRFKQHRDTKPWWPQVAEKTIDWHPSRARALAEEAAAIQAETPAYNIDHNPVALQNPVSQHWPPTDMPTDMVGTVQQVTQTLPPSFAESVQRAAAEGFTRARRDDAMLDAAREARIERWVDDVLTAIAKPTPTEAFDALVAEAGVHVEELDETLLDEKHRGQVQAFYVETGGEKVLCLPAGQTPDERLHAVRVLLTHLGVIGA